MKVPIVYLREQLGFNVAEWNKLEESYKDWYRNAAIEEMKFIEANGGVIV